MKTFLINLDRSTERLADVSRRLAERGVEFERFPAVDGRALDPAERRRRSCPIRSALVRGFMIRAGELGCALSHLGVYRRIVAEGLDMACVLEDDSFPEPEFAATLARLEAELDARRAQVVLLSPISYFRKTPALPPGIHRLKDAMNADAYVITRPAAEAILRVNDPVRTVCDYWGYLSARAAFELCRLVPSVSRQNSHEVGSEIASERPDWGDTWRWKLWRAFGKTADWLLWKLTGR